MLTVASLLLSCLPVASAPVHGQDADDRVQFFRERPDPEGQATEVLVSYYTVDLELIDDLTQSFVVDLFLVLRWEDPRLALDPGDSPAAPRFLPLDDVWTPELQFYNQRSLERRLPEVVAVTPSGSVKYRQHLYGRFSAPLDLREFPMDRQRLPISIVSASYGPDQVQFVLGDEARDPQFSLSGWNVGESEWSAGTLAIGDAGTREIRLARMDYVFPVERLRLFYALKVIGPLTLIMCMALVVFVLRSIETAVKVRVSTTACLTLIAFLFGLGRFLPPISYLTRLDYFVFRSLALVFVAFMTVMLCAALRNKDEDAKADKIDASTRWLFFLAFLGIQFAFWS